MINEENENSWNEDADRARGGDVQAVRRLAEYSIQALLSEGARFMEVGSRERSFGRGGSLHDIVQDVVLEAVYGPSLQLYDSGRQSWKGFIVQRLRWRVLDAQRSEQQEVDVRVMPPEVSRPIVAPGEDAEDRRENQGIDFIEIRSSEPSRLMESPENCRLVRRGVRRIRNQFYRRCLILHDLYDWGYPEIAHRFQCREGRVRNAVCRARAELAEILQDLR